MRDPWYYQTLSVCVAIVEQKQVENDSNRNQPSLFSNSPFYMMHFHMFIVATAITIIAGIEDHDDDAFFGRRKIKATTKRFDSINPTTSYGVPFEATENICKQSIRNEWRGSEEQKNLICKYFIHKYSYVDIFINIILSTYAPMA